VQPAATRWNSICDMVTSVLGLERAFEEIKETSPTDCELLKYLPEPSTYNILKALHNFLLEVKITSDRLTEDKHNIQNFLPMIYILKQNVNKIVQGLATDENFNQLSEDEQSSVTNSLTIFVDALTTRMDKSTTDDLYSVAALINPQFKGVPLHKLGCYARVLDEVINNHPSTLDHFKQFSENNQFKKTEAEISQMDEISREVYEFQLRHERTKDLKGDQKPPIAVEFDHFLSLPPCNQNNDHLAWWKENSTRFPILSALARDHYCIPVTSAASERVFSTGGRIVSPYRGNQSAKNTSKMIFIQHNWDRINLHMADWNLRNMVSHLCNVKTITGKGLHTLYSVSYA
jgi:hAT family C-terminal dimerisation region